MHTRKPWNSPAAVATGEIDVVFDCRPRKVCAHLAECFFRPTPCGFRQVVQQLFKPVAHEINYLIRTGADAVVAAKVNWKRTDT